MDLKSAFGCHTVPFTREIPLDSLYPLALFDQARDGILRANSALEADRRCILRRMRRLLRDGVRP